MEKLSFIFKKERNFGELFSDYIGLFKLIFKHFNKNIIVVAVPFMAILMVFSFFSISYFVEQFEFGSSDRVVSTVLIFVSLSFLLFLFMTLISIFGIEYMLLLEERGETDFGPKDIFASIRKHLSKYIAFFLASTLVIIIAAIPFSIVAVIFVFIPIIGQLALGIIGAIFALYLYCSMLLYLTGKQSLFNSFFASFHLIGKNFLMYGLAGYCMQMIIQIFFGLLVMIPVIVLGVIAFTTIGFNEDFFTSFGGKMMVSAGIALLCLLVTYSIIYIIGFYVLSFFSLLEKTKSEQTIEDIESIGENL